MAMTKAKSAVCIKFAQLDGTTAATNIAVTGIAVEDTIVSCIELASGTALPTDRTSTTTITSAGNIQCSTATTGDFLLLHWLDNSA